MDCEPGSAPPIEGVTKPIQDGPYSRTMIALFRLALGSAVNYQARSPLWHYDGLVEISERLHRSVTSPEARIDRVAEVFNRFHPPQQPQFLQNNQLSMTVLGQLTEKLFPFLVGPSSVGPWERDDGTIWNTKVSIERCRFLEASGCKSMCVGLCKQPSEAYFASIGLPLSFTPDFETGGCEMVWGRTPTDADMADVDLSCFTACDLRLKPPLEEGQVPQPKETSLPSGGVRFSWASEETSARAVPHPSQQSPAPPLRARRSRVDPQMVIGLRGGKCEAAEEAKVVIKSAGDKGDGAFAGESLVEGQWVGTYVGTPVTLLQTAQRYTDTGTPEPSGRASPSVSNLLGVCLSHEVLAHRAAARCTPCAALLQPMPRASCRSPSRSFHLACSSDGSQIRSTSSRSLQISTWTRWTRRTSHVTSIIGSPTST